MYNCTKPFPNSNLSGVNEVEICDVAFTGGGGGAHYCDNMWPGEICSDVINGQSLIYSWIVYFGIGLSYVKCTVCTFPTESFIRSEFDSSWFNKNLKTKLRLSKTLKKFIYHNSNVEKLLTNWLKKYLFNK